MRSLSVIAAVGLLFALPLQAADPAMGSPVRAVWREQRMDFSYMGRTARYSCQGLRDKMRSLLLDLGARRDLRVSLLGCNESAPLVRGYLGPRLSLDFFSPQLPDPSVKPLSPGDLLPVDARYESFILTSDAFKNYGVGDCELIEEFARDILPRFGARNVKRDISCIPYQASGSRFFVRGEILRAARIP
ncbi:MAG TPA: hypothetical protein VHW71_16000 [Steroidobacteraceae bacterium]|jgi:hypothetical protein|nr:hypothetical protein [Steroidobacteraceae bacterium]